VKSSFLAGVAIVAITASVTADAADLVVKARPVPKAPYNWSGFYLGANVGAAWSNGSLNIPGNNLFGGLTEFIGGVQAGYNFQAGHLLAGLEGDFDGVAFGHPAILTPTLGSVTQNWIGTLAGRVGLAEDVWLLYGKFGGGWVQSNALLNFPGVTWQGSNTSSGWLVGGGIEYGFKPHWTIKLEYDQIILGTWTSATVPPIALNRNLQTVKFGANYKFESGVSDASAAKSPGYSREPSEDEGLAQKSQNPIADMVSVPFQSNTNFNAGPFNRAQEVLNIQPVVPLHIDANWNLISRTIMPVISQPSPIFDSNTNGIGDITQEFFSHPPIRAI
jgi:opacity protein-like surface antigen